MKKLSPKLKSWRKHKKITQREACELIGVPIKTYIKWEHGERTPSELVIKTVLAFMKKE